MKIVESLPELFTPEDQHIVHRVMGLPHKMLQHHDVDGLSEMILHELGHDGCFGLKKATYLLDNPDFDHLRGVAGFCKDECKYHKANVWDNPAQFGPDMKDATFRKTVKQMLANSLKKREVNLESSTDVMDLGKSFGMRNPSYVSWHGKHGNLGVLIYEKEGEITPGRRGLLDNMVALLGLSIV